MTAFGVNGVWKFHSMLTKLKNIMLWIKWIWKSLYKKVSLLKNGKSSKQSLLDFVVFAIALTPHQANSTIFRRSCSFSQLLQIFHRFGSRGFVFRHHNTPSAEAFLDSRASWVQLSNNPLSIADSSLKEESWAGQKRTKHSSCITI